MWTAIRARTFRTRRSKRGPSDSYYSKNVFMRMKIPRRTASERQRTLERQFGKEEFHFKYGNAIFQRIYWGLRRFQYWLCFYDTDVEIDIEDLLTNPFNTQPPSLDELRRLTGFKRDWIMFLYRNFKQVCSNGRMTPAQWRQIFRLIFKGANDYEFADRIFLAIAGDRTLKLITFEDLILCLHALIESFRETEPVDNAHSSIPTTTSAQFAFNLMMPNREGYVDEVAFISYAKSVFDLNASLCTNSGSGDAAAFGICQTSGSQQGDKNGTKPVVQSFPWLENLAKAQFKALDSDNDGCITLADIQRLLEEKNSYEPLVLHLEAEYIQES